MHSALSLYVCVCLFVCVSEMDSLWPGRINCLPDWLQLSGNVTVEPERDLIAIRELPPSSRGQRAGRCSARSKPPSLREHRAISLSGNVSQVCGWGVWTSQVAGWTSLFVFVRTLRWNTAGVSPAASCGKLFLPRRRCEVAERSTGDPWSSGTADSPERGRHVESVKTLGYNLMQHRIQFQQNSEIVPNFPYLCVFVSCFLTTLQQGVANHSV